MLATRYIALIHVIGLLVAPLLTVDAEEREDHAAMLQQTRETLAKTLGKSSFSIHGVAALENANLATLFPHGGFVRTSVGVVVDPVTQHGVVLEFVIYSHEDTRVVLPVSGERREFTTLLKEVNVHLPDANAASQLAMAYAAIYRLGEPMVRSGGGGYLVRFGLPAGEKIRSHRTEIAFRCDERKKVVGMTETQVPDYIGDAESVSVETIKGIPQAKANVFALRRDSPPDKGKEEALEVEVPGGALIRIAAVRFEESKAAVVVHIDEFFLEYREYDLAGKRWELSRKARLCKLNGALSLRLKEVEMKRFGEAVVRFGKEPQETSAGGWELAVVGKTFPREEDDVVESFRWEGEKFVEFSGVKNRLRGSSSPNDD